MFFSKFFSFQKEKAEQEVLFESFLQKLSKLADCKAIDVTLSGTKRGSITTITCGDIKITKTAQFFTSNLEYSTNYTIHNFPKYFTPEQKVKIFDLLIRKHTKIIKKQEELEKEKSKEKVIEFINNN